MARRRVFRTRLQGTDALKPPYHGPDLIGRNVTLDKLSDSVVGITLDGTVVAQLDGVLGSQVVSAIDRGQSFTAMIENIRPIYSDNFREIGVLLDVRLEYLLEKGNTAIEVPKPWLSVESSKPVSSQRLFFTKIAGVTYEGRQGIVARCSVGERLILIREPNNPFDEGAIKVLRLNGEQLGFIPAHVSRGGDTSGLAYQMDRGEKFQCRIKDLSGGGDKNLGVNIEITEGDASDAVAMEPLTSKRPEGGVIRNSASEHRMWLFWFFTAAVLLAIGLIMTR